MLRTNLSAYAFRFGDRGGSFTDFTPTSASMLQELRGEQRVAIMNQVALAIQDSVDGIGQIPADLAHPQAVGSGRDAGNLHLARRQLDEEQHDEPLQPSPGPHFHGEESRRPRSAPSVCVRNSFQVVFRLRSGAGSIPCRCRISAIVLRAISCPRLDNAPWMRR